MTPSVPEIVYQEKDFFVVNKPNDYYSHPNHPGHKVDSLVDFFSQEMNFSLTSEDPPTSDSLNITAIRQGLVHRLDRETSGLLIMARTPPALQALQELFRRREVVKGYRAIVHGHFFQHHQVLIHRLIRDPYHRNRRKVWSAPDPVLSDLEPTHSMRKTQKLKNFEDWENSDNLEKAKLAETLVNPIAFFKNHTLLEVRIFTGRTHQIRAQLTHEGYPLVGDKIYGIRRREEPPFLMLCAYRLEFTSPFTGKKISLVIDLPDYFSGYMDRLEKYVLETHKS